MNPQTTDTHGQIAMSSGNQGAQAGLPHATTPVALPAPAAAGDADMLEASWADAIEKVVENNSDDPYALNNTLAALRKDYLYKRYGKVIERTN